MIDLWDELGCDEHDELGRDEHKRGESYFEHGKKEWKESLRELEYAGPKIKWAGNYAFPAHSTHRSKVKKAAANP